MRSIKYFFFECLTLNSFAYMQFFHTRKCTLTTYPVQRCMKKAICTEMLSLMLYAPSQLPIIVHAHAHDIHSCVLIIQLNFCSSLELTLLSQPVKMDTSSTGRSRRTELSLSSTTEHS